MRFQVLGEVRAHRDGEVADLGSPQQRLTLAALVIAAPAPVSADKLIDAVWGGEPPRTALATLRTYVSRLRTVLGGETLSSVPGGYALADGERDIAEFAELTARATVTAEPVALSTSFGTAAAGVDPAVLTTARQLLRQALDLWNGPALAGLPGGFATAQRDRLSELWLATVERRLVLDVELGDHVAAIGELTPLCARYPHRERLHGLLMLALYRAGRQAEALAVFEDLRRGLAAEFGTDPSPPTAELRTRILRTDAALAGRSAVAAGPAGQPIPGGDPAAALPRPAQLPGDVGDFTGRESLVSQLTGALDGSSPTLVISAVAGIGGVGKTTLAIHVGQKVRPRFPDGQLYVNLRGAGPDPMDPGVALAGFLRALGIGNAAIPDDIDDRAALFRSTIDGKRLLVLLDNAAGATQLRPLLPGSPGCAVLVTSRARLNLPAATRVDLDVLEPAEALRLFTRILGAERVEPERVSAVDLVAACGYLPLAIRIAAARLVARPNWTIERLTDRMRVENRRLAELSSGGDAVAAAFALSYEQLEPELARAFRLLSVPELSEISLPVAAALLEVDIEDAEEFAETLVDLNLLESPSSETFRFHDLVRLYGQTRTRADERERALARVLDHYLATAVNYHEAAFPDGGRYLEGMSATVTEGSRFGDKAAAQKWPALAASSFLAVCQQAIDDPQCTALAADLIRATNQLYASKTHGPRYRHTAETIADAAARHGNERARARALLPLCDAYFATDQVRKAAETATAVRDMASRAKDPQVYAEATFALSNTFARSGDLERSIRLRTEVLQRFEADGWVCDAAVVRANRAYNLAVLGRASEAIADGRRAAETLRAHDDDSALALGLGQLCGVLLEVGHFAEAVEIGIEAAELYRRIGNQTWEAVFLRRAASAALRAGRPHDAIAPAERALDICQDTALRGTRLQALEALGEALILLNRPQRARVCLRQALDLCEQLGETDTAARVTELLRRLPDQEDESVSARLPPVRTDTLATVVTRAPRRT